MEDFGRERHSGSNRRLAQLADTAIVAGSESRERVPIYAVGAPKAAPTAFHIIG